jgi:hypothetical protein
VHGNYSHYEKGVNDYADEIIKNLFAPGSFTKKENAIAGVREMIIKYSENSHFVIRCMPWQNGKRPAHSYLKLIFPYLSWLVKKIK